MADPRVNPVLQHWQPRSELEAFGLQFVQVFNDHDLQAGLAMCDLEVYAIPSRATGTVDGYRGHDGIQEWWRTVTEQDSWFEILVSSMQEIERRARTRRGGSTEFFDVGDTGPDPDAQPATIRTLALFGDVCLEGESLSPWASVIVVRNGLILRHRSYLSTRELMDEIGVIADAVPAPGTDG